jgi:hypothetical protein
MLDPKGTHTLSLSLSLSPVAPNLEHRASVKRFVSLQFLNPKTVGDRLCGLVDRVSGYRSRGPGFDSRPSDFLRSKRSGTGSIQPREEN